MKANSQKQRCFALRYDSLYYIILKNSYCDAIIPVVKLFWCVALDVDDCRKNESFLF